MSNPAITVDKERVAAVLAEIEARKTTRRVEQQVLACQRVIDELRNIRTVLDIEAGLERLADCYWKTQPSFPADVYMRGGYELALLRGDDLDDYQGYEDDFWTNDERWAWWNGPEERARIINEQLASHRDGVR